MESFTLIPKDIEGEIPELTFPSEMSRNAVGCVNLFHFLTLYSSCAEKRIQAGNLAQVKRCLTPAKKFYRRRNEMVRGAEAYFPLRLVLRDGAMRSFCLMPTYLIRYQPH